MANIFADDFKTKILSGGQRANGWVETYPVTKAAAIADKIYYGVIPAGVEITGVDFVNDAAAVGGTLSLGYEPVDGVSPVANLTAFFTAQPIATAGRQRGAIHPVLLSGAVRLIGTVGGAAIGASVKITPIVNGKGLGIK